METLQTYESPISSLPQVSILDRLLNRYIKFWPLLILFMLATSAFAYIYLQYTVPTFETTATIAIKSADNSELQLPGANVVTDAKSLKNIDNEIAILTSTPVATDVVKDLYLYSSIYKKGKFINRSAYTISPVTIEIINPDSVKQKIPGVFEFNKETNTVLLDGVTHTLNTYFTFHGIKIRFIPNPRFAGDTGLQRFSFNILTTKAAAGEIAGALSVIEEKKESAILTLRLRDEIPARGEDILNDLITVYNARSIKEKTKAASNTLKFVQNRIAVMEGQLDTVETGIQHYKTEQGAIDITQQSSEYIATLHSNEQLLTELRTQLGVLNRIEAYLESSGDSAMIPSTFGIEDLLLTQMLNKLSDLRTQYDRLKKTVAENNPMLASLRNEIDQTKPNILEILKNHRLTLLSREQTIERNNSKYTGMLNTIPVKERKLGDVSRQQLTKNTVYNFFLQKREETELALISATADSRTIESAQTTPYPVSPKQLNAYLIAIAFAMILMIVFIGIKEVLNDKIINKTDIQSLGGMSVLSELSVNISDQPLIMGGKNKSYLTHEFKQLRTLLINELPESGLSKVLVTSAGLAEGKLFVAANLAISLAQAGKKVLLIELDFRNARTAEMFRTPATGLSELLTRKKPLEAVYHKSVINDNLHIMPAGLDSEHAADLLSGFNFGSLLKDLESVFDIIVMVSSPLIYSSDAYLMNKYADKTLFIIREGYSEKADIDTIKAEPALLQLVNASIIYNGSRGSKESPIWETYG